MLSAKKARQRPLIVSGGDRILSDIEKLWIFTIVKMRFGMFELKYQPLGPIPLAVGHYHCRRGLGHSSL